MISAHKDQNQYSSILKNVDHVPMINPNTNDKIKATLTNSLLKDNNLPFACSFIIPQPGCRNIDLSRHMNMLYNPNANSIHTANPATTSTYTATPDATSIYTANIYGTDNTTAYTTDQYNQQQFNDSVDWNVFVIESENVCSKETDNQWIDELLLHGTRTE